MRGDLVSSHLLSKYDEHEDDGENLQGYENFMFSRVVSE
jgi:hypothetical protein